MTTASNARVFISATHDPRVNLAIENFLFRTLSKFNTSHCLFLYKNSPSVIIGRNQNPWRECNVPYLESHNIPIVRRFSGGGTVFHDHGNYNFSVMMPRQQFDRDAYIQLLVPQLNRYAGNDKLFVNERHDIVNSSNQKVSGSAFKLVHSHAYAHGTMLLRSQLASLSQSLRPSYIGSIIGRGVESVRSPVANVEWLDDHSFEDSAIQAFKAFAKIESEPLPVFQFSSFDEFFNRCGDLSLRDDYKLLTTNEWTFNQTPKFEHKIPKDNGHISVMVDKGQIVEINDQSVRKNDFPLPLPYHAEEVEKYIPTYGPIISQAMKN
ncbi:hypothetical protein CANCADRAFT_133781 [Tortispora caseinolytica NRRL Y-17796]|uniref:Putative lipoate-protein ligase A n=1 Tax=Tortispora caseinolytica NRRL Y-17796 TaxID=767744 RepID=A0A1E4TBS4_9ASCO|nr:hypothetical protein CANCADRAFT_133781 [Tortispora caseinolytica NRRL Y-17796]